MFFNYNIQENQYSTIVVLGRGTVGKTSLIYRYVNGKCPSEHDPTVEDTFSIHIETKDGGEKEFKVLDTAGEEDYQNMLDQWISSANGFLLLFAVNDSETFEALKTKVSRIQKNDAGKLPIIIVGNKCDLKDNRQVTPQQGEEYAKSIGAKYYETSALTDENGNVKVVFKEIANLILNGKGSSNVENKGKCFSCSLFQSRKNYYNK